MGQADQAALLVDGRCGLARGQARGDGLAQEEAEQVTVGATDLLAHDDLQARGGHRSGSLGAIDALMVGDGQVGQAHA